MGDAIPQSEGLASQLLAWAAEDRQDDARRDRRRRELEGRHGPGEERHTLAEGLALAETGRMPRSISETAAAAAAAADREDYLARSGKHSRECRCDRCCVGKTPISDLVDSWGDGY